MKAHELKATARKFRTRSGRGISAGRGKTAGRGTKGQNARSGGKRRPGFEGGQNPLYVRLPKLRGFKSHKTQPTVITTENLQKLGKKIVDHKVLEEAGIITDSFTKVKVVLKGEISATINVKVDGASAGAIAAIEKAGGSFTQTTAPKRRSKSDKKT